MKQRDVHHLITLIHSHGNTLDGKSQSLRRMAVAVVVWHYQTH